MMYADVLPGKESSPIYPFTSMVINLNVCTRAHRDCKDMDICVVIALGDFKGGELCLFEPGIVLELCPGDVIIFPSLRITHFNLHYIGKRASVVLNSDRDGEQWVENRNGWMDKFHMW